MGDLAHSPSEGKGLGPLNIPYSCPGRGRLRIAMGNYSTPRDVICTCAPSQVITMKKVGVSWAEVLESEQALLAGERLLLGRLCLYARESFPV